MKKLQLASLTLAALLLAGCGASAASTAESTSEAVSTCLLYTSDAADEL